MTEPVRGTPWGLGIACDDDDCDVRFEGDFLVAEDSTRDERLRVVLNHAEKKLGWLVVGADDPGSAEAFCPAHKSTVEAGQSSDNPGREPNVPPDAALGYLPPEPDDPLWWLSFCDPDKAPPPELQRPGGPSFLGAVITQAPTLAAAITRSHLLKVNPGGEIKIAGPIPAQHIAAEWRDRLLSAAEIEQIPEPEGIKG